MPLACPFVPRYGDRGVRRRARDITAILFP